MIIDVVVQTVLGLVISAFWFYVRHLSERLTASDQSFRQLTERLHQVELSYQSRADALRESEQIMRLLHEINTELKELNDKLNQKADKSH
ncbi:hypothetical protein PT286_04815 [Neisseriaceae bacterium ESL0693]|nr:hypothetical protein [Neisseriaceae bacterium ESL0693]